MWPINNFIIKMDPIMVNVNVMHTQLDEYLKIMSFAGCLCILKRAHSTLLYA